MMCDVIGYVKDHYNSFNGPITVLKLLKLVENLLQILVKVDHALIEKSILTIR